MIKEIHIAIMVIEGAGAAKKPQAPPRKSR